MTLLSKKGLLSALAWGLFLVWTVFPAIPAGAQSRTHNLGDFMLRIDANDYLDTNNADPTGEWPQDYFRYQTIVFYTSGHAVGRWIDSTGTEHLKESVIEGPISYNETEPYGIKEYRKHEPAEVWVYANGKLQLSSRRFNGEVVPTLPSDQMIELHYKSEPGFDVVKKSYSFSNPNHDDYVIVRCRYLCTFDWDQDGRADTDSTQTMQDVYFIIGYCFQTAEGTYITYSQWYEEAQDDWATYEMVTPQRAAGGREMAVSYAWDGDHTEWTEFEEGGAAFDDTGDPRFAMGESGSTPMPSAEFISNAYAGFAALHVDTSPTDHSDNTSQPVSILGNADIYDAVWGWNEPGGFATRYDWASSGTRQTVEEQAGWPGDPSDQLAEYTLQSFGPYNLSRGDSVVIVYAVGANGISRAAAVEKGLEWRDWYRGVEGATFDDAAKNEFLATGRDSLFETMDRALWAYNRGLNIPDPLPAPDLNVRSGPQCIVLEWEDLSGLGDPDTGIPDLDHYNIYRKRGNFLCDTYNELRPDGVHLVWEKIAEVPKDQTTYTDSAVVRGEPYHYAVTAVDDGSQNIDGLFPGQKLESSRYANRSELAAYAFEPGMAEAGSVRIVPNPYILRAGEFNFTGEDDKLLFVNLPPYCTLRIYTVTGDLIKTIEHSSGSADDTWDQITESNQLIVSGVYILKVDDAQDITRRSIKGAIEKFVVIR